MGQTVSMEQMEVSQREPIQASLRGEWQSKNRQRVDFPNGYSVVLVEVVVLPEGEEALASNPLILDLSRRMAIDGH